MNMKSSNDIRARAASKRGLPCAVEGCTRGRHGVGNLCYLHNKRKERTGSPTGRALTHRELEPFVTQARDFLEKNAEHDAIKEVIANIEHWFTEAARCRPTANSKSYDHRLIRELHRLRQDEAVTGEEVLVHVLAIYLLTQANEQRLPPLSREHRFAVAKTVLKLTTCFSTIHETSDGKLRKHSARLSVVLLDRFGLALLEETLSLTARIAATLEQRRRDDRDRQERLKEALAIPFIGV